MKGGGKSGKVLSSRKDQPICNLYRYVSEPYLSWVCFNYTVPSHYWDHKARFCLIQSVHGKIILLQRLFVGYFRFSPDFFPLYNLGTSGSQLCK